MKLTFYCSRRSSCETVVFQVLNVYPYTQWTRGSIHFTCFSPPKPALHISDRPAVECRLKSERCHKLNRRMFELQQKSALMTRMASLLIFREARILYVTSQVGRNRNKASALSPHFSVSPPPASFPLSFPASTLPVSWLSSLLLFIHCSQIFSLCFFGSDIFFSLSSPRELCMRVMDLLCCRLPG